MLKGRDIDSREFLRPLIATRFRYAPSFDARPTYCNVCRYKINARHLLRCEVCKFNVHKRCAAKAINNCKWTTLASVGKDIIEDADGVSAGLVSAQFDICFG
ncbi:hypothetical protein YQE_06181, partial [Dendroctonus ponderosae]